jgi:hypothetical protein
VNRYGLSFNSCVKLGDDIWFSATNYNGLYRYNLKDTSIERVVTFPNEEMWQMGLHNTICLYHDSIVFVPHWAERVSIYNTKNGLLRQIEVPDLGSRVCSAPDFLCGVVYHEMLYMVGYKYSGIVKVDLKTGEFRTIYEADEWINIFVEEYFGEVAVEDNYMYIPCQFQNSILILDMKHDTAEKKSIGKDSNRYCRIVKDGKNVYLIDKNTSNFITWNVDDDSWRETEVQFKNPGTNAYINYSKEHIWVISVLSGEVCIIDKGTGKRRNIFLNNKPVVEYAFSRSERVYFVDGYTGNWYFIDNQGVIIDLNIKMIEPDNIRMEDIWQGFSPSRFDGVVGERSPYTLQYLIFHAREKGMETECNKSNVGNTVWNFLNP